MKKFLLSILIALFALPVFADANASTVGQACLSCVGHTATSHAKIIKKHLRVVRRK